MKSYRHIAPRVSRSLTLTVGALLVAACATGGVQQQRAVPLPEDARKHCEEAIGKPRIEHVAPGIFTAIGYDLANTTLIETGDGLVIVDPGMSPTRARQVREAFGARATGPVHAVIYTHSHIDHIGGASVWLDEDTEIWATDAFVEHVIKQYGIFQRAEGRRGQRQFGRHLSDEDMPCSALGRRVDIDAALHSGFRMPTRTFSGSTVLEVGNRHIELYEAHGETHDQLFAWLPEERVLFAGDNFYRAFPNLYTIRGTAPRPVNDWIRSLDEMRRRHPAILIPSHTIPVVGENEIQEQLRDYRDAVQWIRDAVVRRATKTDGLERIVDETGLPPHLVDKPWLRELYGQVDWSVRAIYGNELGWFDGEAATLYPLAATEAARREVLAMGGAVRIFEMADEALDAGDGRWAIHLLTKLRDSNLLADVRDGREWLEARLVRAYRMVAEGVGNTNGRSYLLEAARELERGYDPVPMAQLPDELLQGIPVHVFFEVMSTRLKPEEAMDVHESVAFHFPQSGERYVLTVRRGVAELVAGDPLPGTPEPIAVVETDDMTWKRLALKIENPLAAVLSGRLKIRGSQTGFLSFTNRFDQEL